MSIKEIGTMRLEGRKAIRYAQETNVLLGKYADDVDGIRSDVTVDEANAIVLEDPRLIYVDVEPIDVVRCTACGGQCLSRDASRDDGYVYCLDCIAAGL